VKAAIFSVLGVVFFHPLPYPHPDGPAQTVLTEQAGEAEARNQSFDRRGWELLRDRTTSVTLTGGFPALCAE
jgi:hypothetical protein